MSPSSHSSRRNSLPPGEIRVSEPGDVNDILRVERECFDQPDVMIVRFCGSCETYLVYDTGDEIAGYILTVITGPESARVLSIAVLEDYRRSGIAHALMEEVIERLRMRDITSLSLEVRVSNQAAKSLYEKLDFDVTDTKSDYYADGENAYVMEKEL